MVIEDSCWVGEDIGSIGQVKKVSPGESPAKLSNVEHPAKVYTGGSPRQFNISPDEVRALHTQEVETHRDWDLVTRENRANRKERSARVRREQDYGILNLAFSEALQQTLDELGLRNKRELLNAEGSGRIRDIDTAYQLLHNFREALIKLDPSRADGVGVRQAKKLNKPEQAMFKLLLERGLGLDFGNADPGNDNVRYFKFSLSREALDRVGSRARSKAEALARTLV